MRGKRRISVAIVMLLISSLIFGGCGKKFTEEDAENYVQGALEAGYHGEFDKMAEITEESAGELEKKYEENITSGVDSMVTTSGIAISDEMYEKYEQVYRDIFGCVEFEIGDVTKEGDEFHVDVELTPFILSMSTLMNDAMNAIYEDEELIAQQTTGEISEDEIYEKVYEILLGLMQEMVDNKTMGEPETITVIVSKNKDGLYEISESEILKIDTKAVTIN